MLSLSLACVSTNANAAVVINELFYHAPDDLDDLEYIELLNTGTEPVDLSGWMLAKAVQFEFPTGAQIEPGQFLVIAKKAALLKEFYRVEAFGEFTKSLSNSHDTVQLRDRNGQIVESVRYSDSDPWPAVADGCSSSLERICPTGPADKVYNWAPSIPSSNYEIKPSGTPGRANSVYAEMTPPEMESVTWEPAQPKPDSSLTITIVPKESKEISRVAVYYRFAKPGSLGDEHMVEATQDGSGRFVAQLPTGSESNRVLRFRVTAHSREGGEAFVPARYDFRPAFSVYVNDTVPFDRIPVIQFLNIGEAAYQAAERYRSEHVRHGQGGPGPFGVRLQAFPPQGHSAVIYTDPATGNSELFDFVNLVPRKSGLKIRFHKDRLLLGMNTVNLLYEPDEGMILNEALAYDLYRLAGNVSYQTGYMRLVINGIPAGYHLFFEQPNSNFLRRNKIDDRGDLYKLIWMENAEISRRIPRDKYPKRLEIARRYEKKTHRHDGYQELISLINQLERTKTDDEMWALIEKEFEVDQVINYFAVNSLLSHWDGFFNNFFTYFDREGTGKWSMYPWDQDSTWSLRGGPPEEMYRIPIFFGAEGATPNGIDKTPKPRNKGLGFLFGGPSRNFGGPDGRFPWWRDGGDFSRPLLANPEFYQRFRQRLNELCQGVFTHEVFDPKFDKLAVDIEPEVKLRAKLRKSNEDAAVAQLKRTIAALKEHLTQRRAFVLSELEKN